MKRADLLKAAPLGLLAACGSPITAPTRLFTPTAKVRRNDCDKWKFDWGPMAKSGGHGYAEAYYRPNCNAPFALVGGIYLDFLIDKGGSYLRQNLSFTANGQTETYQLDQLVRLFGAGQIVQLFKKWYWQVTQNGRGGTLYDSNSNVLGTAMSTPYFASTTITMFLGSSSGDTWDYDWGQTWQGSGISPDISLACAGALATEFGCSIAWVVAAIGTLSGPIEWLGFAGVTAALFGSAALVLSECNK